jgi:hypothetical protein
MTLARSAPCLRMNTDLPAPEEYYRLTRARELRRKAARLERCVERASVITPIGIFLIIVSLPFAPTGIVTAWGIVAALMLVPTGACVWEFMNSRVRRYRAEAQSLEAEHQLRRGALSAGKS